MRKIKFRAWDKKRKRMCIQNNKDTCMFFVDMEIWSNRFNQILMQFTGLKDKNGKEIYEGDIIICRDGKYIIEYCDNFAQFIMTNKNLIRKPSHLSEQDANMCMRSIEVIGNIYENPELLEDKE